MAKALAKRLAYCLLWIVVAALVAVCLALFFAGAAEAGPRCVWEGSAPKCADENPLNGYWDTLENRWVPGYVTPRTHQERLWGIFEGRAVSYAPGVMEATAAVRGLSFDGYLDGVALMPCGNLGEAVWLKRPGEPWEGPYLVADCARRGDLYPIVVFRQEVVEVGYETAQRWGVTRADGVLVAVGSVMEVYRFQEVFGIPYYPDWWLARVVFE